MPNRSDRLFEFQQVNSSTAAINRPRYTTAVY